MKISIFVSLKSTFSQIDLKRQTEMIECPIPLPWSSWNCHCPTLSDANNESLPICECGNTDTVQRSRIQLCAPSESSDQLSCGEIGRKMKENHPGECHGSQNQSSDWSTSNWYSQSDWKIIENSFIQNLTKSKFHLIFIYFQEFA